MSRLFATLVVLCVRTIAKPVTISNVVPRRDLNNAILDAHDSKLNHFNGLYYWHAASYGNCTEPAGDSGCADANIGACGFQTDHNVTLYTSPDLVTWTNVGIAFGALGNLPPNSVLFAPKTVYNKGSGQWVMWFNYITGSFANSFYGVAVSPVPEGPFVIVNHNVELRYQDNGDEDIFVDDDGSAYVIYTTLSEGHSMSIEKLADNYTQSLGAAASSGIFGHSFVEAPAMFKRNGVYYAVFGSCCCYCGSGSVVTVYTASAALGPYTARNPLGALPPPASSMPAPIANGTVTVLSAVYAANCAKATDVTTLAAAACNGSANCSFAVCVCGSGCPSAECISDPALYCAKALEAVWTCSGDAPGSNRTRLTPPEASGVWAEISCFPPAPPTPIPFGSQQTTIFAYTDSTDTQQFMYVGDHWQSAPDGLKAHDFTVWAPLVFDATGNVSSPGFLSSFTVDVASEHR